MRTARSLTVSRRILRTPPWQPRMPPPATTHAPQATMHAPLATTHAPRQPCTPPWTEFLTHASENITLPQTSFAGRKKMWSVPYSDTRVLIPSVE